MPEERPQAVSHTVYPIHQDLWSSILIFREIETRVKHDQIQPGQYKTPNPPHQRHFRFYRLKYSVIEDRRTKLETDHFHEISVSL